MKIQNTLTQKELEILLRFANWAHTTFEWRFGQAIFNGLHIMFPATAEEIRGKELDPFYRDTVKADFYAAICPDPPKEQLEEIEWEEQIEPIRSCGMCGQHLMFQEEGMCELCLNEYDEHLEENV